MSGIKHMYVCGCGRESRAVLVKGKGYTVNKTLVWCVRAGAKIRGGE